MGVGPWGPLAEPSCGHGGRDPDRCEERLVPCYWEETSAARRIRASKMRKEVARGGPPARSTRLLH
eukprot:3526941-Alexandrium_andersonii.AAC.1